MKKLLLISILAVFVNCNYDSTDFEHTKELKFKVLSEGITDLSELDNIDSSFLSIKYTGDTDIITVWNYNVWYINKVIKIEEKPEHIAIIAELQENTYPVPAYGNPITYQTVSVQHTGKMYVLSTSGRKIGEVGDFGDEISNLSLSTPILPILCCVQFF
jgi:hypothetical protein